MEVLQLSSHQRNRKHRTGLGDVIEIAYNLYFMYAALHVGRSIPSGRQPFFQDGGHKSP